MDDYRKRKSALPLVWQILIILILGFGIFSFAVNGGLNVINLFNNPEQAE